MFEFELPAQFRRYVPLLAWLLVVLTLLVIPLKIIGTGYLPGDDALRHVAKAVSGKSWPEILVLGPSYKIDHNLGWHEILTFIYHLTNWSTETLVIFCVVALFLVINGAALPWLKRPEAWLVALVVTMLASSLPQRFMLGRPFALTIAVLMTILFAAEKSKPSWKYIILFSAGLTACTFVHGVWYLWVLPIAAFVFAGQFQWAVIVAISWVIGVSLAAALTGHPVEYLAQAIRMALNSVGEHMISRTQVTELQPFDGDIFALIALGALVFVRGLTKPALTWARSPAFWLMCGTWLLGFRVSRFWVDWGWPALMVLIACETERIMVMKAATDSLRRLLLTAILSVLAFLSVTNDHGGRWTQNLTWQFLSVAEHPELEGWMPDKGGIIYTADMGVFYKTFFKNPKADWRYDLGYEPTQMPKDDFETFKKVYWNYGDVKAYQPWVDKMTPANRLILDGSSTDRPNIPVLDWNYGVTGLWIGRLPRWHETNAPAK